MKKYLFVLLATLISLGAMAQAGKRFNSNKNLKTPEEKAEERRIADSTKRANLAEKKRETDSLRKVELMKLKNKNTKTTTTKTTSKTTTIVKTTPLTPEEKAEERRIADSTKRATLAEKKKEADSLRKVQLMQLKNKNVKAPPGGKGNKNVAPVFDKKTQDSIKKAEMTAKKTEQDSLRRMASMNAKQKKIEQDSIKREQMFSTKQKKAYQDSVKKATMSENKAMQDSIKRMQGMNAQQKKVMQDSMRKAQMEENKTKLANKNNPDAKKYEPKNNNQPNKKGGKEPEVVVPQGDAMVVTLMYAMPLECFPQISTYSEDKEEDDTKSLRRGFIKKQDPARNYAYLQLPSDNGKHTSLQLFNGAANKPVVVVETTKCAGECSNSFKMFTKDSADKWVDKAADFIPVLDKKYILSKIKAKYKKDYKDAELFDLKGYEGSEAVYKKALIYIVDPEKNRILVKDQYTDLAVYALTWSEATHKLVAEKL
ncbi:MAG: hypothetical protein NTX03_06590 [Bacteroidetes bacterium]|nr:hypothetical protein [Bacteroidota bacterium]